MKFDLAHTRCILAELYPRWASEFYDRYWAERGAVYDKEEMDYLHFCRMGKDWELIMARYEEWLGLAPLSVQHRALLNREG